MANKVNGLEQAEKRCIDCVYYPSDCGYWDGKQTKPANRINPEGIHNCPDYAKDGL